MGWFDDDDNESDDEQEHQHVSTSHNDNGEDEEEDPLDAYMATLNASASSPNDAAPRSGRLDMEMEDEATSHWHETKTNTREESGGDNSAARQALDSMFHRAGDNNNRDDGNHKRSDNLKLQPVHHDEIEYQEFEKSFFSTTNTQEGHSWRHEHDVTCMPGTIDPIFSFQECRLTLGNDLYEKITNKGFTAPTLVQSQTLPVAFGGHDALVTASTGSGKTLAYTWPMIVHLSHQSPLEEDETGPMAIVLVPTRELALQVHKQVKSMLPSRLSSLAITGGISNYHLLKDLKKTGCHVVVATPGRFLDLLGKKKKGLSLERVTFIVLDEADRMLSMGFEEQVTSILQNVRPDRQSLLLSATMGQKVERVARQWLHNPVRIAIGRTGKSSEHVQQHVMVLPSFEKKRTWLLEMLPILKPVGRTLVFVATRNECEELAKLISSRDDSIRVETLHGEKHQSDRNASLRAFSRGNLDALIATDVAARGLDVENVSTVINFDPAKNLDAHVHRIGRAGRLSKDKQHKKGVAYTLLTHKNADFAHVLVNAFDREGREVTNELKALANKSRHAGNVASRTKWNKAGIGFHERDPSRDSSSSSHYGPSTSAQAAAATEPPTKRSRWG